MGFPQLFTGYAQTYAHGAVWIIHLLAAWLYLASILITLTLYKPGVLFNILKSFINLDDR